MSDDLAEERGRGDSTEGLGQAGIEGANTPADDLAELHRRIAALEIEQAKLLARRAADLESENALLRADNRPMTLTRQEDMPTEPLTPPYVGRALIAVESYLHETERWAALGNEAAASESKVAAASRACETFRRLCDDDSFAGMLMAMQTHASEHRAIVSQTLAGAEGDRFRALELELLELAGVTRLVAQQHVNAAIEAYNADPTGSMARLENPMRFLSDLRKLRDGSCLTSDLLTQGVRQEQSRQRWKKLLTFGLGGTAIVVANSVGTALLGPGGVAASGAIGSAAVGVAAQLVA